MVPPLELSVHLTEFRTGVGGCCGAAREVRVRVRLLGSTCPAGMITPATPVELERETVITPAPAPLPALPALLSALR
jgi:hypothetical protein